MQSIHDGKTFVHEPRRLAVIIESETDRIDAVLNNQPAVRELFDNGWLHLICITGTTAHQRRHKIWQTLH